MELEITQPDGTKKMLTGNELVRWKYQRYMQDYLACVQGVDDGVGQVSGTWKPDRKPFNEIGILIYIMVDDMEQTIRKLTSQGGELVQPVGADFPEITARFLDPSGNLLGLFQEMG